MIYLRFEAALFVIMELPEAGSKLSLPFDFVLASWTLSLFISVGMSAASEPRVNRHKHSQMDFIFLRSTFVIEQLWNNNS